MLWKFIHPPKAILAGRQFVCSCWLWTLNYPHHRFSQTHTHTCNHTHVCAVILKFENHFDAAIKLFIVRPPPCNPYLWTNWNLIKYNALLRCHHYDTLMVYNWKRNGAFKLHGLWMRYYYYFIAMHRLRWRLCRSQRKRIQRLQCKCISPTDDMERISILKGEFTFNCKIECKRFV